MKRLILLAAILICTLAAQARTYHLMGYGEAYCHGKVLSNGVVQFGDWVQESFEFHMSNQKVTVSVNPEQTYYVPTEFVDLQRGDNDIWKAAGEIQTVDDVKGEYNVLLKPTGEGEILIKYGNEAWKYRVRMEHIVPEMEQRAPTDAQAPSRNGVGTSIVAKRSSSAKPGKPQ